MDTLDLRGLRCPLPLLRLKQALHLRTTSEPLLVLTSDPGALRDIPAFLRQGGHALESVSTEAGESRFQLRKAV